MQTTSPFILSCRGNPIDCRPHSKEGAQIMGILNVTPDSFSDGGSFLDKNSALAHAENMLEEGAKIIDIGGASTRPRGKSYGQGAPFVEPDEEKRRVLPVIENLRRRFPEAILSLDTYHSDVARDALDLGVHIINDVTGLRYDEKMARVIGDSKATCVIMHSEGPPGAMQQMKDYEDVVAQVSNSLRSSISKAAEARIHDIAIDPGFGFGKCPKDNLALLSGVDKLLRLERPVLVGISRKSTIGTILGTQASPRAVHERLFGTLGATAMAVFRGASLVRTHDVAATRDMLRVMGEMMSNT